MKISANLLVLRRPKEIALDKRKIMQNFDIWISFTLLCLLFHLNKVRYSTIVRSDLKCRDKLTQSIPRRWINKKKKEINHFIFSWQTLIFWWKTKASLFKYSLWKTCLMIVARWYNRSFKTRLIMKPIL